jgi:acetyltransferase-like isoleucine patch superfamily enzyme
VSRIHLGIIGAGGFGREVVPYANQRLLVNGLHYSPDEVRVSFVITTAVEQQLINGIPVLDLASFLSDSGEKAYVIAIADAYAREKIAHQIDSSAHAASISHPTSLSLASNSIAPGSILSPYTVITADAIIGKHFHANIYSYVAHDCVIGDYVTFAPGVKCNGNVHIED